MNVTGWSRGLEVSGGGQGIVSHAGLALLRQLADRAGLTAGLSRALASRRRSERRERTPVVIEQERLFLPAVGPR